MRIRSAESWQLRLALPVMQINSLTFNSVFDEPEWLRPPSWRWNTVLKHFADPSADIQYLRSDPLLFDAVRVYRLQNLQARLKPMKVARSDIATALKIFCEPRYKTWRWMLEALMMTNLSDRAIARTIGDGNSSTVLRTYRQLFFDVDAYRDSPAAIMANVLGTSEQFSIQRGIGDYTWKAFAYVWGAEAFLARFCPVTGVTEPRPEYDQWLVRNTISNLNGAALQISSSLSNLYDEEVLNILKTASGFWNITPESARQADDKAKQQFVTDLQRYVTDVLEQAAPAADGFVFDEQGSAHEVRFLSSYGYEKQPAGSEKT